MKKKTGECGVGDHRGRGGRTDESRTKENRMGGQRAGVDGRNDDSEENGVGEEDADGSVTGYGTRTNELVFL